MWASWKMLPFFFGEKYSCRIVIIFPRIFGKAFLSKHLDLEFYLQAEILLGPHWWLSGKESACQRRRRRFDPWVWKIPWRKKWQPIPVFLSGKSQGEAWWATAHGVTKSHTQLSDWTHRYFTMSKTFLTGEIWTQENHIKGKVQRYEKWPFSNMAG